MKSGKRQDVGASLLKKEAARLPVPTRSGWGSLFLVFCVLSAAKQKQNQDQAGVVASEEATAVSAATAVTAAISVRQSASKSAISAQQS